jgi:predicted PurR-regulated permease PerM
VLSFLLNFVPNIGFLLSVIPPALLALIELGIPQAVIVVVGFVLINGFFENVVKPRFIEQDLDIAPAVSFISLILWTWVFGALGAIIAIPMTMLVQLLLESSEETRWLGYLLGTGRTPFRPEPPAEPDPPAPLLPGDEPPASAG